MRLLRTWRMIMTPASMQLLHSQSRGTWLMLAQSMWWCLFPHCATHSRMGFDTDEPPSFIVELKPGQDMGGAGGAPIVGQQLWLDYGEQSSDELMLMYGFVPSGPTPHDRISLEGASVGPWVLCKAKYMNSGSGRSAALWRRITPTAASVNSCALQVPFAPKRCPSVSQTSKPTL